MMESSLIAQSIDSQEGGLDKLKSENPSASRTAILSKLRRSNLDSKAASETSTHNDTFDDISEDEQDQIELVRLQSDSVVINLASAICKGWRILDQEARSCLIDSLKPNKTPLNDQKVENDLESMSRLQNDSARMKLIGTLVRKKFLPKDTFKTYPKTKGKSQ